MTILNRCRIVWTGFPGQPGYSNFYFSPTQTNMAKLVTFLNAVNSYLPNSVLLTVPATGDQINTDDGAISGVWTGTGGGTVSGFGGTAAYSGSSGIVVDWKTSTIIAGRRRQGRTYFVPASVNAYQSDGTILEAARTQLLTAAGVMISGYGTDMQVFSRPYPGKDAVTGPPARPAKPARPGAAATVVAAWVPDIAAVMRSRRQ